MPETPELGIPYPSPADAITDWPAQAQELAETVEAVVLATLEQEAFVSRDTNYAYPASSIVLQLPAVEFDGATDYWVELFAAVVSPGALSYGGGGGAGVHYIVGAVTLVQLHPEAPANPTDMGKTINPFYAKVLVRPAAGTVALYWTYQGASGPSVQAAPPLPKAWMRLTRAEL